jgi:ADP-ribose pyrophosphatase
MSRTIAQILSSRRLFAGRVLALDLDEVEEPGGVRGVREVVRHPGSVAMLPVHEDGRVVLVSQYRHPVGAAMWELPAGRLEPGETPEVGARREMEEEVGLLADHVEPLSTYFTSPGFCDEVMHLFRATGLRPGRPHPDADEVIETLALPLEEALAMVARGEIREGKTLVALLLESERRRVPPQP